MPRQEKMEKVIRLSLFIFLSLCGEWLLAQNDTTLLSEVSVVEHRTSQFAVGSEITSIDSSTLRSYEGLNLSDMLRLESPVFVKYYSPGNLASTSFRGANAQQTALTWNGFNINSPLNGIFDLSLFPVSAFDEVKIQPGASSALWGSGAMGGSIHLGHQPDFKKHFNAQAGFQTGSFGYHYENAAIDFGSKRFSHRLTVVNQYVENDFPYLNPFTGKEEVQTNNEVNTRGLLSENHIRVSKKDLLSLNIWLQETDRNIPPSLFETTLSNQKDNVNRLTSEWRHQFAKSEMKIRGAWFSENQDYTNISGDTSYFNNNETFIGEAEYNFRLSPAHRFDIGLNSTSFLADVQSYGNKDIQQHRQSLFGGYQWKILDNLNFSAMLRQEMVDDQFAPFTYTFGINWKFLEQFTLKGQYSRVYRTPTLNDIYWVPGGNAELQSEYGNAMELSAIWARQKKQLSWRAAISGFSRTIENWILWQPSGGIWTPQNLLEVWSRGLESNSHLEWSHRNFSLRLNFLANYTLSTNEKTSRANDASLGKQLIYTPIYSGTAGLELRYKKVLLRYSQSYTGYTYTTSDHSEWLEPYQLGSVYLAYHPQWKKFGGSLFCRINNVWDQSHQVVRSRPMPGVSFNFGISLNLKIYNQK